jgi:molecular chaperone GrpE
VSPEIEQSDDQVRDAELNAADDQAAASSAPVDDVATGKPVVEEDVQEEIIPLAIQLEQAEARAAEYLDSLQRERAAFQNFRRRVERERDEQAQTSAGRLLVWLLRVLDDFYRALDALP